MIEIYIPPQPGPGRDCVRVANLTDAATLLVAFARPWVGEDDAGEVFMIALGHTRELLAVIAFGDVSLDRIVDDPRPLVTLALSSCCSEVLLAQIGAPAGDVLEARRVIGSALAVDDITLIDWLDVDPDPFTGCR